MANPSLLMCHKISANPKLWGPCPPGNFGALEDIKSKISNGKSMFCLQLWILREKLSRIFMAYGLFALNNFRTPFPRKKPCIFGGKKRGKKFGANGPYATSIPHNVSRRIQIWSYNKPLPYGKGMLHVLHVAYVIW